MVSSVSPYLTLPGTAAAAIAFYAAALGAEVGDVMHWSDIPGGDVPPDQARKVMHAELSVGGAVILLCDAPAGEAVTTGNHLHILLHCTDPADVDRLYAGLVDGGAGVMPPANTFWNARYAQVTDRFGITWSLNAQAA